MVSIVQPTPTKARPSGFTGLVAALDGQHDSLAIYGTLASWLSKYTGHPVLVAQLAPDSTYEVWHAAGNGALSHQRWDRYESGLDMMLELAQPVRLDKLAQPAADLLRQQLWLLPRHSLQAVSLPAGEIASSDLPYGCILLLDSPQRDSLTLDELGEIARLATLFLDRAALQSRVARQQTEFTAVAGISRALAGSLDLATVFDQLNGPIRATLNVETLSVGILEPATGDIIFVSQLLGPEFADLPSVRIKKGQGIAGWVADHREPVIINDTYADKRFYSGVDSKSGFRTRSMICIPLQVEGQTVGVLQAINRQGGQFTDSDLAVLEATGGPLAAAIVNANLNRERLAEQKRIETIMAEFAEALAIVTRDHIILQVNDGFCLLTSFSPEALIGRPIQEVVNLQSASAGDLIDRALAASGSRVEWLDTLERGGGQRLPVLIQAAAVPPGASDATVGEVIVLLSDLTLSNELERMRDDLFQSIINELRTPLATILMYARLLRKGRATTPEKSDRFLGVIERESDRLQSLVRQMLDLSSLEAREFRRSVHPVQIGPLLRNLATIASDRAVAKGLLFSVDIDSELPLVLATTEMLERVFGSLLDNAIKFTPSGTVELAAAVEDNMLIVRVRDDGIGIPPEAQPHLFKRFYRTHLAVERGVAGTGLGLYLVKESVREMGGRITVTSQPGEGATFIVSLPVVEE